LIFDYEHNRFDILERAKFLKCLERTKCQASSPWILLRVLAVNREAGHIHTPSFLLPFIPIQSLNWRETAGIPSKCRSP
jgi:hypothetical protein